MNMKAMHRVVVKRKCW